TTTGLSPSAAGLLFILLTGGLVFGSLSAGRIISKTGRYKPFAIASLTCWARPMPMPCSIMTAPMKEIGVPAWICDISAKAMALQV
ncbi:hypothetical protein AB9E34_33420, partial [Rhizobium leguminosarum]|uniref:hypothetical protein n=1 Tax=Rhizobium leguminosarum TaxID=384 RepID=UPI003F9CC950